MKEKEVKIQKEEIVFDDYFKITKGYLRHTLTNGRLSDTKSLLKFGGQSSAACLVFNADTQKLIFTKQFRYPVMDFVDPWLLEIPAGRIEGELTKDNIRENIAREIYEEIGYDITWLDHIRSILPSPGAVAEVIHIFFTIVDTSDNVASGGGLDEESEDIEIVEMYPEDAFKYCKETTIMDAKTLIALGVFEEYWNYLKNKKGFKPFKSTTEN